MVSALVYVMHIGYDLWWIMTQGYQLPWFTKLLYCWTLNLERILSLCQNQQKVLTYVWNLKVVIYPYGLGHCWWKLVATCILNRCIKISNGIETVCPLRWSKWHVLMKSMAIVIPLVEFNICSLKLKYISWSYNKYDL